MHKTDAAGYPFDLNERDIARLLPHRGEILCIRHVKALGPDHFIGQAVWPADLGILRGHFPALPIVPGVLLVEAVAQAAGVGMLACAAQQPVPGDNRLGLLAGIRKCSFRRPVRADEWVEIEVRTRRMSPTMASVVANLHVSGEEVAGVEIVIADTTVDRIAAAQASPAAAAGQKEQSGTVRS